MSGFRLHSRARRGLGVAAIACLLAACADAEPAAAPTPDAAAVGAGTATPPAATSPAATSPTATSPTATSPTATSPTATSPTATAACGPVETPALQGGSHLLGDQPPPVPYASVPPTSGWHASGAFSINVRGPSEALSEPQQVSVLEAGGVVATYRDLDEDDRGALEETATMTYPGRVAVTPYDRLEQGEVAFTAWGALQRCDGLDLDALAAFVDTYADPQPAIPGEH